MHTNKLIHVGAPVLAILIAIGFYWHGREQAAYLPAILAVVLLFIAIGYLAPTIDCDDEPFIPQGWSIKDHHPGGKLKWLPEGITLWLGDGQETGRVRSSDIQKQLRSMPIRHILNACVLDFLYRNQHLIPKEWIKGHDVYVCFFGTIYLDDAGRECVRCLCWFAGEKWELGSRVLKDGLTDESPICLREY